MALVVSAERGKLAALMLGFLVVLCSPSRAQVQRDCFSAFYDNGITWQTLREYRPDAALDTLCPDEECRAIKEIGCAIEAMGHRAMSNSLTYRTQRDLRAAQHQYGQNIRALGKEHPRRIPLYCDLLAKAAAAMTGVPEHDKDSFHNIVQLAILLDRPRRRCFEQVAAAMPKDARTQADLRLFSDCIGQRRCHRRMLGAYEQ